MNFLVNGHRPACFDRAISLGHILGIKVHNKVQMAFLEEILDSARSRNVKGKWFLALAVSIGKNRTLLPLRPAEKALRQVIGRWRRSRNASDWMRMKLR